MNEFKCMLAKEVSKEINFEETHFVQPKLDGVRCYAVLEDGEVKLYSRNNKEFKNAKHIATELKPVLLRNPNLIMDGELYNHKYRDNFNKIISLVRKQKPSQRDSFESSTYLQYHIYDIFNTNEPTTDFIDRHLRIFTLIKGLRSCKSVKTDLVTTRETMNMVHKKNKEMGYEGSMLRQNKAYEQKRSYTLQKIKDWSDTEITITSAVEGKGKFSNGLGKFIGVDKDNRIVEVPWPSLTIPERQFLWKFKKEHIGSLLTFQYFERTPAGAYRFPRAKAFRRYE